MGSDIKVKFSGSLKRLQERGEKSGVSMAWGKLQTAYSENKLGLDPRTNEFSN